jgi:hypothetical protein
MILKEAGKEIRDTVRVGDNKEWWRLMKQTTCCPKSWVCTQSSLQCCAGFQAQCRRAMNFPKEAGRSDFYAKYFNFKLIQILKN